jgi:UDP-N-acetylglucosamine 2-epimerase (non-hydrolysing)
MIEFEKVCLDLMPDLVIVVGDVNSTIACALTAVKLGVKVAHVEAGLRSFDRTMPEEINRIATDAICDFCFVTEDSGMQNLRNENFPPEKVFFVGNTMIDSLHHALPSARESDITARLGLVRGEYALVTLHRPSNVDDPAQLREILDILSQLARERKVVFPVHPRTRKNISSYGLDALLDDAPGIILTEALGYIDFLSLMMNADFVLTDSGGIQEETTALGVPCITSRVTTERPVTCTLGTNILVQPEKTAILGALDDMLHRPRRAGQVPPLWDGHAAERIVALIHSHCL